MLSLYITILILVFIGIGFYKDINIEEALSIKQCNAIKGVSILLVFISHANSYIVGSNYSFSFIGDDLFLKIQHCIGQLCVVMFLFYSGYGTEHSILTKGVYYANRMPKRRILSTLLNFDVAVFVFLIINIFLGINVSLIRFIKSLIAWESIGNSNWYIFDILLCYLISYISTKLSNNPTKRLIIVLTLSLFLIVFLFFFKSSWWYDTILAYSAGMFIAQKKDVIYQNIRNNYYIVLLGLFILFILFFNLGIFHIITYSVASVLFSLLLLMLTMKIKISNRLLLWFGRNLFPLYIYQRVPMLIISHLYPSFVNSYPIYFCIISFCFTVTITFLYKFIKISF